MTSMSASSAAIMRQVVRQLLREIAAVPPDGGPRASATQLTEPRVYMRVSHRELAPDDPLIENSPVISTSAPRHHLYESFVLALPGPDDAGEVWDGMLKGASGGRHGAQEAMYDAVYALANPVHSYAYGDSTGWLVTESAYDMLLGLLALRADEEQSYLTKAFARSAWTGNNRGMHEPIGTLVRQVTRHPAFAAEELLFRQPTTLLFLTHRGYLNTVRRYGISPDIQEAPSRGFFAVDTDSYPDSRLLLSRINGLVAVEFTYQGPAMRGFSPLNVPIYRIPEAIPPEAVRSIVDASSNRDLWLAAEAPAAAP
jgi:hypothetical protein